MNTLLTVDELSARIGRKRTAIYRDIKLGLLPAPVRVGLRGTRFRLEDIQRWEAALQPIAAASRRATAKATA